MATTADVERATRIEFGGVPDDSTGEAVPEENHELEARGISGFSQRATDFVGETMLQKPRISAGSNFRGPQVAVKRTDPRNAL